MEIPIHFDWRKNMNNDIFNGVIPSPYSPYDYSCRLMGVKEHDPEYRIDVRGKVYDQSVGNCVAQTVRAFARVMTGHEYGVDMMYGGARSDNRETSGLYTREAADFFIKNGIALISDDPNETDVTEVITYWNNNKSRLCKVSELSGGTWYRVETVEQIKCAIESGVPVWCAVAWYGYQPLYEGKGLLRYTPDKTPGGYHEMLIVGWKQCSDGERAIFLNSHGDKAGDEGYCYGKWEHVLALNDCIVMNIPKQGGSDSSIVVQRTLRLKSVMMTGDDVKELQELLNKHGIQCVVNGVFDEATDAAVREFQTLKDLAVDGIVGKETWEELRKEPTTPTPDPEPTPDPTPNPDDDSNKRRELHLQPKPRMEGEDVKELQSLLNKHGIECDIDGIFGPATDEAVKQFQSTVGIPVTGIVNDVTWEALFKDPASPEPEPEPTPEPDPNLMDSFINHLYRSLGNVYVRGADGETNITKEWIKKMDIPTINAVRSILFWNKQISLGAKNLRAYDCCGLISRWLEDNGFVKSKQNCNMLYDLCVPASMDNLQIGDLVFRYKIVNGKKDYYHIGVYVGDGRVIEAKGRDDGVVIRPIYAGGKTYWMCAGRLKIFE